MILFPILFASVTAHGCPHTREHALDRLFDEVHRLTGDEKVTLKMMDRFEHNLPRIQRWVVHGVLGGKGTRYILMRCAENDVITREIAQSKPDTCISTCTLAHALNKFLDWGYAKYWAP